MSKNQTMETVLRSGLGAVPWIGTALNESLFEHRSRVKQKRINKFTELLFESLSSQNEKDFKMADLDKDMLGDVLESVVRKAAETGSEEKLKRLRNILIGHIKGNSPDIDLIQSYLNLTSSLSDVQIIILENFASNKTKVAELTSKIKTLDEKLVLAKQKVQKYKSKAQEGTIKPNESIATAISEERSIMGDKIRTEKKLEELESYKIAKYYSIDIGEFMYYQRDLISKGLIFETFVTQMGSSSSEYSDKEITLFGEKNVKYIKQK